MKKLYKVVSTARHDDGLAIQLDGRVIKTPSGKELVAPTRALADAICAEWSGQGETVDPATMPLTQILTTAIDKMRDRDSITVMLTKYLDTDLLCYRAKEPAEMARRQAELWDPWLVWFDEHFESPLDTTTGLKALTQDEDTHRRVWNYIEALDEYYFAALHIVTALSGSIVLGLAFLEGAATPSQVFEAAQAEEDFHAQLCREEVHGRAPNQEKSRETMRRDLDAAQRFLQLVDEA